MMTAMVFISSLYALGIIPLPNLYVTWFEHSRPVTMQKIKKGTHENATVYHLSSTILSNLM